MIQTSGGGSLSKPASSVAELILSSEFAQIAVSIDETANGPRLRLRDVRTGMVNFLDPLELEALAWARHRDLAPIMDPGASRWVTEEDVDEM